MPAQPPTESEHVRTHACHHAGPFRITHKSYSRHFRQGWHEHDRASLDFVLAGAGEGTYGAERVVSLAGAVEYFAAGLRHRFDSGSEGIRTLHLVMPREVPAEQGIAADTMIRTLDASRAIGPAARLLEEISQPSPPDALLLESLAMRLVEEASGCDHPRDDGPWLAQVREMLLEEPGAAAGLADLAERAGVHRSHLARQFRRAYGVTVGEFGRRVRLAAAARRLAERSGPPLATIALEQGFSDQAHFSRCFRSAYGCTPLAFRRRLGLAPAG